MKTIRGLFYKTPKFKWKYWVNWLISIRTMSKYSHCEIWIGQLKGLFEVYMGIDELTHEKKYMLRGTCYTSTMRGDDNGTVKRDASLVLKHPRNWHYVEIPLTDEQYRLLLVVMDLDVANNKGYAMWDILKFVSPVHFNDKGRNICSEAVNNWLVIIGILKGWGIISPKAVLKKLLKCGYKVKSLKE